MKYKFDPMDFETTQEPKNLRIKSTYKFDPMDFETRWHKISKRVARV